MVGFVLLTSVVKTETLRVRGTVTRNWRPAYDILVRPAGSFTPVERSRDLVRANYLSGSTGGITLREYKRIRGIPGVTVAAPIANLGYVSIGVNVGVLFNGVLNNGPEQLYRVRQTWIADRGTSRYPGPTSYVYYTRAGPLRTGPEGNPSLCDHFDFRAATAAHKASPFAWVETPYLECFSSRTPNRAYPWFGPHQVGVSTFVRFPMLLAAIDPVEENRLVSLDRTVVAGRALTARDRPHTVRLGGKYLGIPVLVSTRTYVDETLRVVIERLAPPSSKDFEPLLRSANAPVRAGRLRAAFVQTKSVPADPMYQAALHAAQRRPVLNQIGAYRSVSTIDYAPAAGAALAPSIVSNPYRIWRDLTFDRFAPAPPGNQDVQFRTLLDHYPPRTMILPGVNSQPVLKVIGRFDPKRLPGFSPLSAVPLESYYPPLLEPANPASTKALGGRALQPSMNLGGYIAQPPLLFTTLRGLSIVTSHFSHTHPKAPIASIRVRVAGVTGPNAESRARIKRVALAIHRETGLAVDITAGSSPQPVLVDLPAGKFGRPELLLREGWVKKGVAVVFLKAVNRKSASLFVLVLVVCLLFLLNAAFASVKSRRRELGTLRCLGWSRRAVFATVLSELTLVGLIAGLVGAGIGLLLVWGFSLDLSLARTLVVIPVSVGVAVLAGLLPAWRAGRVAPLESVGPAVAERSPIGRVRALPSLALSNLARTPGRTLLGALCLTVGVCALAVLLSLTIAFHDVLTGTLLGDFISTQVRAVDYVSVALAICLAALSVADVLAVSARERAPELATLRATGWNRSTLARLISLEGVGIGILGSLVGGGIGLALALVLGGNTGRVVLASVVAAVAGVLIATVASLLPALAFTRRTAVHPIAEE